MVSAQRFMFITGLCTSLAVVVIPWIGSKSDSAESAYPPSLAEVNDCHNDFLPVSTQVPGDDTAKQSRAYRGYEDCAQCHANGTKVKLKILGKVVDLMKEQWVYYTEIPIWAEKDKHVQAYTVLANERSREMAKKLNVDVRRDRRCLACHTGFPLDQMPLDPKDKLVDRSFEKSFDVSYGVSCEGCHGPSGDRQDLKGWNDPHRKSDPWRFLAPEKKQKDYGFFDVRSPSSKTRLCLSCHIGDVEKGRIVTHEMYAAGHPPLPGFEIETFTEQMPRHWTPFHAKSKQVQESFLQNTKDPLFDEKTYRHDNLHRTRTMLVGSLVSVAEYLRLLGQFADSNVKSPVDRPTWPELALFDCYACHHDLKNPSWRQERKTPVGTPGRPAPQEWSFALATIALKQLGVSESECDNKMAEVRRALRAQPFGEPKSVAKSCETAAGWFLAKAQELERQAVTKEKGATLLKDFAVLANLRTLDYDSARQLVWAFKVLDDDLKGAYANADKVKKLLESMDNDMFLLDLRKGRKSLTKLPGEEENRETMEVLLETVLRFISSYEPGDFQKKLRSVAELLK